MTKRILTDVDGVLLDWVSGMKSYLENEMGFVVDDEEIRRGFFISEWLNISRDEASKIVADYHASDYFKNLNSIRNAETVLKDLGENGYRFVAITSALNPYSTERQHIIKQNRMDNLTKLFGHIFDDVELVCIQTECKSDFLKKYDATWWVEDHVENAIIGQDIGHKSLVMHSDYFEFEKAHERKIPVIQCWQEASLIIKKDD